MLNKVIIFPLLITIKAYQIILSPILGNNCRFLPTCSEYAIESLKAYGLIKGFFLTVKRIGKCHPWGSHGYDPLPSKNIKNKYE